MAQALTAIDTSEGAGDAFAGGLAWALLRGDTAVDAARVGVAASSCVVSAWGSQEAHPSPAALAAMLARVPAAEVRSPAAG